MVRGRSLGWHSSLFDLPQGSPRLRSMPLSPPLVQRGRGVTGAKVWDDPGRADPSSWPHQVPEHLDPARLIRRSGRTLVPRLGARGGRSRMATNRRVLGDRASLDRLPDRSQAKSRCGLRAAMTGAGPWLGLRSHGATANPHPPQSPPALAPVPSSRYRLAPVPASLALGGRRRTYTRLAPVVACRSAQTACQARLMAIIRSDDPPWSG